MNPIWQETCGGITKNTTAKITLGHGLIYDKLNERSLSNQWQKVFRKGHFF